MATSVYRSKTEGGKQFILQAVKGSRTYDQKTMDGDSLFIVSCDNGYPFKTDDVAAMAYHLIKNKSHPRAAMNEALTILKSLQKALNEPAYMSVCAYGSPDITWNNCKPCPLYCQDGHCHSPSGFLQRHK